MSLWLLLRCGRKACDERLREFYIGGQRPRQSPQLRFGLTSLYCLSDPRAIITSLTAFDCRLALALHF